MVAPPALRRVRFTSEVPGHHPSAMTCRRCGETGRSGNHCAYCLWSVHWIDSDAWLQTRWTDCGGLMRPVRVRDGHRCTVCGQRSYASA